MNKIMKAISIALKLAQALFLVIGLGLVGHFTKEYHDSQSKGGLDPYDLGSFGRYEFYLYSASIGIIIAVVGLISAMCGVLEKKHGILGLAVAQALWTFQLLISTSLLAKVLTTYKEENSGQSTCESWDKTDEEYNCGQLTGGVVCGILAMAAFALDTVISFKSFNKPEA